MAVTVDVERVGAADRGQVRRGAGDRRETERTADRAVVPVQDGRVGPARDVHVRPAVVVAVEDGHAAADEERKRTVVGLREPARSRSHRRTVAARAAARSLAGPTDAKNQRAAGDRDRRGHDEERRAHGPTAGHRSVIRPPVRAGDRDRAPRASRSAAAEHKVDARRRPVEDRRLEVVDLGPVVVDRLDGEELLDAVPQDPEARRRAVGLGQERVVDHEGRVGPDDLDTLAVRGGEPGLEVGEETAREAELADERAIDAALVEPGEAGDPVGLLAGDPARDADRVAADVPERPAAELGLDPRVVRVVEEERERGVDHLDRPERAGPRRARAPAGSAGGGGT